MTTEESLRLECLRLAMEVFPPEGGTADDTIVKAGKFYDFVAGKDRAALADEAKAAIDRAVR